MPKLDTEIHTEMLRHGQQARHLRSRLRAAARALFGKAPLYGMEWGEPDFVPPLTYVRDHFLVPYISADSTIVEVGPGGGRWTRYMLAARRIFVVDYHRELLDELRRNFDHQNITFIKNNGDDFPGVPDCSVDFLFSFGCFVHLDTDIIARYLDNMRRLLKPGASVVLHYSDKTTPIARSNAGFSDNDPGTMRALVLSHRYTIHEEDMRTMWHSGIVRFGVPSS